ncbi:unnamed protein product [Clonostachys rosea]|uniref:Uncharacterized protein n=1 Tax=Bionectria ochroleuca TaxID=29856 RepID=A0ABY6TMU0_BIOOC|nr:unnamed protein product [Clonostachys rosea]
MFSPVPSNPSSPLPRRGQSSDNLVHDERHYSPATSSINDDDNVSYQDSLFVKPLAISRPRPDSSILPQDKSDSTPLLDPRHFTAVVRRGETVQYWLPVELVIKGLPGRGFVPDGHWERLVELAEDVSVCTDTTGERGGNVQLVTAWCHARELTRNGEHVNYETTRD